MGGASRSELEYFIPQSDALEMLRMRLGSIIEKIRHIVPACTTGKSTSLRGDNAGLIIAEVQLPDAAQPIVRPEWVGEEVTHDLRYYNARLALQPYSCWQTDHRLG
jgi:adenylate cyclase